MSCHAYRLVEKTFGTKIGISDKFQYQISKQLLNNNFY